MARSTKIDEVLSMLQGLQDERKEYSLISHEEHEFLREIIEESKARKALWTQITTRVIGGGIWILLLAIGSAVAMQFKQWVHL